jgi:hypothetical protein
MTSHRFTENLGWLVALVATFALALSLDAIGRLSYFTSLCLWVVPIVYLWPLFRHITRGLESRRRALRRTVASIVGLGIVLDFVLGHLILRFDGCVQTAPRIYVYCLPAIAAKVPIEEVLFYATGPIAMVLVYACADELWLQRYNPKDDLTGARLVQFSPQLATTGLVAAFIGVAAWIVTGRFPAYYAFLVVGALLPAIFLYRCIGTLVNWPAFALTSLYVILTSLVWEVTFAIPRGWWAYNGAGIVGPTISAWSRDSHVLPVEAVFVWLCAPFSAILSYEFAKALIDHPFPAREALFGRRTRS